MTTLTLRWAQLAVSCAMCVYGWAIGSMWLTTLFAILIGWFLGRIKHIQTNRVLGEAQTCLEDLVSKMRTIKEDHEPTETTAAPRD